MDPFSISTLSIATLVATALGLRATKKKTLTPLGVATGCTVGFLLVATGLRGMNLLFFYQIGTMATRFKKSIKEKRDATLAGDHSARGAVQVLCVSLTTVVLSLIHAIWIGRERPVAFPKDRSDGVFLASCLTCAVLAHHATCLADTLASELGILSTRSPILITQPWRFVPPGTNGGITITGTVWSIAGGAMIGCLTVVMDWFSGLSPLNATQMIFFGGTMGLVGSMLDSLLGATLQSSYYDKDQKLIYHANSDDVPKSAKRISGINILTNEQVNFFSALASALLGGFVIAPIIFRER
ncbi:integral membrane protein DUF92 [Nitzschia inconspicua]|uniref:Integral membrane protein DUF92 n=1 Tax=Nitzschia inconspicua TaxID=303405 RepID=A0A9K3M3U6_9STRA|nr:integral membrane protein DUF92 [Nitzschia inconspicua]